MTSQSPHQYNWNKQNVFQFHWEKNLVHFLPAATKLWPRLCFYTCVWFCSQGGGYSGQGEPPRSRHPPPPPGRENPPSWADPPRPDAPPPQEAHSSVRSTSGRYASYWNAFFSYLFFPWPLKTKYIERNCSPWIKCWNVIEVVRMCYSAKNFHFCIVTK